jgi:hypothetical protein
MEKSSNDMWNDISIIPEYNQHYLVYFEGGNYSIIHFWADSWENFIKPFDIGSGKDRITHWAKLPLPSV